MKKLLLAMTTVLIFFVVNTDAQAKKKRVAHKPAKGLSLKETLLPAEYEINAVVLKGQGVLIVGITPMPTGSATNESSFQAFLNDHFGIKVPTPPNATREYPKIVIRFMAEDDVATLVNAIKLVSVSDKVVVELESMLDLTRFIVPPKMTEREILNIKPNPLALVVEMNVEKGLTLNDEEMGNLSDTTQLVNYLKDIFRRRSDNGVFRENSNDIEKTVFIKMPLTESAGDLIKIAKALQEAGSDIIGFQVDDPVDERKEIEPSLLSLPPKKKPTK